MIARTEIGRATGALTQARALSVGSEGYWWRIEGRNAGSHRKMKDKFVRWDNPPTLDGMTGHAGCLPNCKCWLKCRSCTEKMKNTALSIHFMRTAIPAKCYENVAFEKTDFQPTNRYFYGFKGTF
jgi:uncharacterized protein with gpF-like domain